MALNAGLAKSEKSRRRQCPDLNGMGSLLKLVRGFIILVTKQELERVQTTAF